MTDRWINWIGRLAVVVGSFAGGVPAALAAGAASDNAGNYSAGTFTNGSNAGSGFAAWGFSLGANAVVDLADSTAGSGNINSTNDLSFRVYGGTGGTFADALRPFGSALSQGDVFSVTMAYNWNGGIRGLSINHAGGELMYLQYRGGNELAYGFAGGSDTVINSDYISTAVVAVAITQLAGNALSVTITRNDGFTTNLVSGALAGPATAVKFYNGGHDGDNVNYALFANDLAIVPNPASTLALSGHDAMAAGMTNELVLTRGGINVLAATFTLSSSEPAVASVPASVDLDSGATTTNFSIEGLDLGVVTVTATNVAYPGASHQVAVYDLGYDDSSYAAGSFTNGGNSGLGFQPWILQNNNGEGEGFTNYAGAFIGNSTFGGPDVNASSGDSFALYANGQGGGNPYANAIRQFNSELAVGQVVSFELGVNFRNGAKGVVFQNSGFGIFELGVYGDDYVYKVGNDTPVSLGWDYASDSAIKVEMARVAANAYNVTIIREGSAPETNMLNMVSLPGVPNEVRFFNFNTDSGDNANNLYFNRLALYSGVEIPTLSILGNDGMVVDKTNVFTVTRTGSTNDALVVTLSNSDAAVIDVPVSVEIPAGAISATFSVVALSNGVAVVGASGMNVVGDSWTVETFDIAYDDTTYYPPALFENAGNGGTGFQAWTFNLNDGPGEGYTNYVGAVISDSTFGGANVNSSLGSSFALYANAEGPSTNAPLAEAIRPFAAELAVGQSVSFDLGVNFRNGAKGVMFQNGGTWLLELAVFNDDYWYNVRSQGDNPVSLGWTYASDSAISVVLSRTAANSYNLSLVRSGSNPENSLIQSINMSQAPDRVRFYVYSTDSGDANNLYFNDLAMFTGTVGESLTDGIPNSWWDLYSIPGIDRVAAADYDDDGFTNYEEYIADTNPDNNTSYFDNRINSMSGTSVFSLQTGPTTNSRVYDIWWSTNLMANPQQWNRLGVTTPGNGGTLSLPVTNTDNRAYYRTGVALP